MKTERAQQRRVLIPDWLRPPADVEGEVLGPGWQFDLPCAREFREIPDRVWEQADAVLLWHDMQLPAEAIDKLSRCRVIVRCGVGYDNVDVPAAAARQITVCNVPDYGTNDVADHALALYLALARGLLAFDDGVRRARPLRWDWLAGGELTRLAGKVFGIIGLGRIGTATALRAKAFGLRVVFCDPYVPDGQDKALGVERLTLEELLSCADAISLHVPLTGETRNLVDGAFLARMKRGALLINTSRGQVVDLRALEGALLQGHLRGAGLDVLPEEPPRDDDSLIAAWRASDPRIAQRLLITPHAAFFNGESYRELRAKAAAEVRRVFAGEPPRNPVPRAGFVTVSAQSR